MKKGILYGVSVGPGDPELLTIKALKTIEKCKVIAAPVTKSGATVALDIASKAVDLKDKDILKLHFTMSSDPIVLEKSHKENANLIAEELAKGNDVSLLNLGDISIFSTYKYLDDIIAKLGYETAIIPGVTSFCAIGAAFKKSLTQKDKPLVIIPAGYEGGEKAISSEGTKVLMKYPGKLSDIKETLKKAGIYNKSYMASNCTMADEQLFYNLDDAPEDTSYFSTIICVEE